MWKCSKCGNANPDTHDTCVRCGNAKPPSSWTSVPYTSRSHPGEAPKTKKVFGIPVNRNFVLASAVIAVLLIIAIVFAVAVRKPSPDLNTMHTSYQDSSPSQSPDSSPEMTPAQLKETLLARNTGFMLPDEENLLGAAESKTLLGETTGGVAAFFDPSGGKPYCYFANNQKVDVLARQAGCALVHTPGDEYAWVDERFATDDSSAPFLTAGKGSGREMQLTADGDAELMFNPYNVFGSISSVPKSTILTAYGTCGSYTYVKYGDEYGWIQSSLLNAPSSAPLFEDSSSLTAGSYVTLGTYGNQDIEWHVLAVNGNEALLITRYGIACRPFNKEYEKTNWESSSVRSWLNNKFYSSAFSADEQKYIKSTSVKAEKNPDYTSDPGGDTKDKVFMLSLSEAKKYFSSDSDRKCKATSYAEGQGAKTDDSGYCWWWLRSPGFSLRHTASVHEDGAIGSHGFGVNDERVCVRPAIWVTLN